MDKSNVVIIGAGLAGLSAACHLNKPSIVLEKDSTPGGKSRSITTPSGATFDFTGHLLHLRKPEMISLVEKLLPGKLKSIQRHAGIFMEDTFLPYPFQANFYPLSRQTVKECLLGFIKAWSERQHQSEKSQFDTFAKWAIATFGEGICGHFLFPYNTKLYCTAPEKMSAEWVSWSVPQPDLEAVIDGALGRVQVGLGYNASFLYPEEGGIELLPVTLATQLDSIHYNSEIKSINPKEKTATDQSGREYHYDSLISTMPLPRLCQMVEGFNSELSAAATRLRFVNIYNLNFVIKNKPDWQWQWLYLPENKFRCYRIGVSSNISQHLAGGNGASVYTEVSYLPEEKIDPIILRAEIIADLKKIGLINSVSEIVEEVAVDLNCAYVVHDQHRAKWLPGILEELRNMQIFSTGRWGAWEYGGMEDAMWQGYQVAQLLNT